LIPWNPHPEALYERPLPAVIDAFQSECKRLGLPTYLRTPRGDDIDAACGQLANRSKLTGASAPPSPPLVPLRIRGKRPLPEPPAVE
jgi:23S rRNA (adenine2503-C2)-methyltransferase